MFSVALGQHYGLAAPLISGTVTLRDADGFDGWVLADFNGDGYGDLVAVTHTPEFITVWQALGSPTGLGELTIATTALNPTSAQSAWRVFPGDVNGDGRADLLLTKQDEGVWSGFGDSSGVAGPMTLSRSLPVAARLPGMSSQRDPVRDRAGPAPLLAILCVLAIACLTVCARMARTRRRLSEGCGIDNELSPGEVDTGQYLSSGHIAWEFRSSRRTASKATGPSRSMQRGWGFSACPQQDAGLTGLYGAPSASPRIR